jgi:hypothetical protein
LRPINGSVNLILLSILRTGVTSKVSAPLPVDRE